MISSCTYPDFVQLVIYCVINLSVLLSGFRIPMHLELPRIIEKKKVRLKKKCPADASFRYEWKMWTIHLITRFVKLNNAICQVSRHAVSWA